MYRTICVCLCLASLLIASVSFAQNNRSAVSVNGSDANPCTTVSPCRSFGVALAHTNPDGEVIALDSGGYGAFTISQPVSVIGAPRRSRGADHFRRRRDRRRCWLERQRQNHQPQNHHSR